MVDLDSDKFLGTTYAATARTVRHLGLRPTRLDRPAATDPGTVIAVDQEGRVRVGSSVTLTVSAAPAVTPTVARKQASTSHPSKKHHGKPAKPGKSGKKKH